MRTIKTVLGTSAASLTLLLLAGCSSSTSVDQFADVRAVIDTESHQIELPLERFGVDTDELATVLRANDIIANECLAPNNYETGLSSIDWSSYASSEDRRYGIWDESAAASYGYGLPPNAASAAVRSNEPDYIDALAACQQGDDAIIVVSPEWLSPYDYETLSVLIDGFDQARYLASQDSRWQDTHEEWTACLNAEDLVVEDGEEVWTPDVPEELEAAIRVALIDINCKESTDFIQRMADVEAQYQEQYIDQHEAALLEVAKLRDDAVAEASEVVASRG